MRKPRNRLINKFLKLNKGMKLGCGIGAILVVGFITWLIISMATARAELSTLTILKLPEFNNLEGLSGIESGKYAITIDGEVVAGSDESTVLPTASTAKMILGLAIMQARPFGLNEQGDTITITDAMYDRYLWYFNNNGSTAKVEIGEEISEYDALMAVFLVSSNNMADSLAEWAFGSLENYREYASQMLTEQGISNTTIGIDASGYDPSTTSTPSDLAKIGKLVLSNPVLREIVGTKEYEIPVAGVLHNTNQILGINRTIGVKTGYIGEASGYCLISGYLEGDHIITVALLGAPTRTESFDDSLTIINKAQETIAEQAVLSPGQVVGYYDSWWAGPIAIRAKDALMVVGWDGALEQVELIMNDDIYSGILKVTIGNYQYTVPVESEEFALSPTAWERLLHAFGWEHGGEMEEETIAVEAESEDSVADELEGEESEDDATTTEEVVEVEETVPSGNCTIRYGNLMLINPNFTVTTDYIDARRSELVSVSSLYGIVEGNPYNGDNLLDAEAALHLNEMVKAYEADYPGHTFETRSCYRARGTTCGRLCAATGASDHHTGLTCDLLDPAYGTSLDTDTYSQHIDWQWLYANSYKYGFIDRFPEAWAGGSMSEPLNVDENGSTGLFETWHYRYVGVGPATDIATGKYNNGQYDSLEHYLKSRGMVSDLKLGKCE